MKNTGKGYEPLNGRNCTSCQLREKVEGHDTDLADFWRCLAVPIVPAFCGTWYGMRGDQAWINLRSFDDDHPCHEYQRAKECPLWHGHLPAA